MVYEAANLAARPPLRRLRRVSVAIRSGRVSIISCRATGVMPIQPAISSLVRPQPMQNWVSGSTTQTFTQGVSISGKRKSSIVIN